ncbi:MAG: hypothetical protein ABIJ34_04315 [archaeon]
MKMTEWQTINIPENNFSILIEGDIQSKKEIFAKSLLVEQLNKNNKISLLSFNPNIHAQYLLQKCPGKENLILSKETVDALTEIGITISELIEKQAKVIYSDSYNLLTTKNQPDMILRSYNFNLKKLRENKVLFIESIDPTTFNEMNISKFEALFDVVLTIKHSNGKFIIKYKKHTSEDPTAEHEVVFGEINVTQDSLYEFYKAALQYELANIGYYGKNLDLFDEADSTMLFDLAKSSLTHAAKFLDKIKKDTVRKEKIPKEEKINILNEGLKEERFLKEYYYKIADQTNDREMLTEISGQEQIHEDKVNEIIGRVKNE